MISHDRLTAHNIYVNFDLFSFSVVQSLVSFGLFRFIKK